MKTRDYYCVVVHAWHDFKRLVFTFRDSKRADNFSSGLVVPYTLLGFPANSIREATAMANAYLDNEGIS